MQDFFHQQYSHFSKVLERISKLTSLVIVFHRGHLLSFKLRIERVLQASYSVLLRGAYEDEVRSTASPKKHGASGPFVL